MHAGGTRHTDWYSLLGLTPDASTEQVTAAVERLSRQANALAITGPERAGQLRDQVRAIKQDLLAGTQARQRYDEQLRGRAGVTSATASHDQPGSRAPGLMSRISKFLQTGWTCTGCGYSGLPGDKFCPKCGSTVTSGLEGQASSGAAEISPSKCDKCGTPVQSSDGFCTRCGHQLGPGVSTH